MLHGMDYLGGAMFPKILIDNHPAGWAAGFFAETFGNCWPVADKLLATGKCPRIRIQGPWTKHEYNPGKHDKAIFAALKKCNELKAKHPHIHVQFSPVCENDDPWGDLLDRCGDASRGVEIVASVGKDGQFSKKFMNEVHGPNKKPTSGAYQYSYDGTSTVDSDVEKDKATHKDAQVIFFWHPSFNLKYRTKTDPEQPKNVIKNDTSPPRDRICKPTPELIKSMIFLSLPKGATNFPAGWIGKSHADRSQTPIENRAYKPAYITTVKDKFSKLVLKKTSNGAPLIESSGPEPFNDKDTEKLLGWRYYFPKYGYQVSVQVLKIFGDGKELGTCNLTFRDGKFRE